MTQSDAKKTWTAAILLACLGTAWSASPPSVLHQYVFFNRDRDQIERPDFVGTRALEGAEVKYTWRHLEPEKNQYDFSDIHADLKRLAGHGKKLFVQIQDASFDIQWDPVPRYLLHEPAYHGGATKEQSDTEASPEGWVARRWDPAVRERFVRLLQALGHEFDGRIEGIVLPETAIEFGTSGKHFPPGFTPALYAKSVQETMRGLKAAFPHTVCLQYANFMPGEWLPDRDHGYLRGVYAAAHTLHVGVGGPDVLPNKPGQMQNSYSLLHATAADDLVGMAVQEGNYDFAAKSAPGGDPIPLLTTFARDYLHAHYLFWCTEEPYYSKRLIPYLRSHE
jgi:hypothetical protein